MTNIVLSAEYDLVQTGMCFDAVKHNVAVECLAFLAQFWETALSNMAPG